VCYGDAIAVKLVGRAIVKVFWAVFVAKFFDRLKPAAIHQAVLFRSGDEMLERSVLRKKQPQAKESAGANARVLR
jgi:hypothetical protein